MLNFTNYYFNPYAIPVGLVSILIFFIGFFILHQNRKSIVNISFFLICFNISFWLFTISFVYLSKDAKIALVWYKYFTFFGVVNIMPSVYLFSLAWSGHLHKQIRSVVFNFILSDLFYFLAISSNLMIKLPRKCFWGFYPYYEKLSIAFIILFLLQFVIGFGSFLIAYLKEKIPIIRVQRKLIAIAFTIAFTASVDFISKFFSFEFYPFGYLSMLIFISIVAYAIIRYRAFDIETVIHKTSMWLAASSIVFVPIILLSYWLYPWYREASPLKVAFLCGLIFYLLTLYLNFIQPRVDHFFQRRKYDLQKASEEFTLDLVHLKSPGELIKKIQDTIKDTLYAEKISVQITKLPPEDPFLNWLTRNDTIAYKDLIDIDPQHESIRNDADRYFKEKEAIVAVPLALDRKLLGIINLSKKSNLKHYSGYDFQFLHRLKNEATIALSNSLLYGRVEEEVKIRTDELIQTQKQLIQAEKLATVGTLAGGVAHEINNPLAAVLTNAQMLLMETKADDEKESLQLIEQAAKRCREIVQKLMVYSRRPLGGREIKEVDLEDVLNNVLSFLGYQLNQDNIKITTNLQNPPFILKGNQGELEQVFANLILNAKDAIKHAKKSGNINISLARQDDKIIINLKDDGIGISKEHLSKIFDPFFTTKDVGKGTGLGLSICQSIVEGHKGNIEAESQQGQCTVFKIQLPAILSNAASKAK